MIDVCRSDVASVSCAVDRSGDNRSVGDDGPVPAAGNGAFSNGGASAVPAVVGALSKNRPAFLPATSSLPFASPADAVATIAAISSVGPVAVLHSTRATEGPSPDPDAFHSADDVEQTSLDGACGAPAHSSPHPIRSS